MHYLLIVIVCFVSLSFELKAQNELFDDDPGIQELIRDYFSRGKQEGEVIHFSTLTEEEKISLFYKMIDYPKYTKEAYFRLFKWYMEEFPESSFAKAEIPPLEYALLAESEVPAMLISDYTNKIPQTVLTEKDCDLVPVSSLYFASEMASFSLFNKMLEQGIKPDSICYDYWLEYADEPESFLFFSKYNDTTYYDEDRRNVLDYFIKRDENDFIMDISIVRSYREAYNLLVQKIIQYNNEGIIDLYNQFMPMHLNHEAKKQEPYYYPPNDKEKEEQEEFYYYTSDKLRQLTYLAVSFSNIPVLDKLAAFQPSDVAEALIAQEDQIFIDKELQDWLKKSEMLPYLYMTFGRKTNPFLSVFLIANGFVPEKNDADTRDFLLKGGTLETLAAFYASKEVNVPDIFKSIAKGDEKAMMEYLESNKNPFITDKYGLSLFELLLFSGMEKPVTKICSENKYLAVEEESIALALIGKNKKVLSYLVDKVNLSDYVTYLYHTAFAADDKTAVEWLVSKGYSAEDCLSSIDDVYEVFKLFSNYDLLKLALKAGLKNQVWDNSYGSYLFLNGFNETKETSLFEFAVQNRYDEAVKMMSPYFYGKNELPNITVLSLAALTGTPEMVEYLIDMGLSANTPDSAFRGISPLEVAVYVGNTEVVKKMVEMGADYSITPYYEIDSKISRNAQIATLADISGSLSTLEYLERLGSSLTLFLNEQLETDIRCWKTEKVKATFKNHPYLWAEDYFQDVLYSNNEKLGTWFLENYDIPVKDFSLDALRNTNKWLLEYFLDNPTTKDTLLQYRDEDDNTLLHKAVESHDVEAIKLLIEKGFDPNTPNKKGYSAYYLLLQDKYFENPDELISLMQTHGASDNFDEDAINNGFLDAIKNRDLPSTIKFLKLGADPNQETTMKDGYYWSSTTDTVPAIYAAMASGNSIMAETLLMYGADPNAKDEKYETPLLFALRKGDYNTMRMLIYKGANVAYVPKKKEGDYCEEPTPLIDRIKTINVSLDIYEKSPEDITNGDTLLARAIRTNDIKTLDDLFIRIDKGEISFWKDHFMKKLLKEGSLEMVTHVLDKNYIEFNVVGDRLLFLWRAIENKRLELITSLPHDFYSKINLTEVDYDDPMIRAVTLGNRLYSFHTIRETIEPENYKDEDISPETREIALKIIQHIATNVKDYNDSIYIAKALYSRFYEAAAYFLSSSKNMSIERKALLNIINNDVQALEQQLNEGLSPDAEIYNIRLITCAAWVNNTDAVLLLLDKGADVSFSNNTDEHWIQNYYRPVVWGFMLGNQQVVSALAAKGADFNYIDFRDDLKGYTALTMLMIQKDKRGFFKQLLEQKIIHYATGNNAHTLLTQAITLDDPELVRFLLKYSPEEMYYADFKGVSYYAPTNLNEAISYAVENEASKVFFDLINDVDIKELKIDEYAIRYCYNIDILKWLLDKGYKMGSEETYRMVLSRALGNNDNELFYRVYKMMEDTFSVSPLKDEYAFRKVVDDVFLNNNIEIFKFLINNGLTYKQEYLLRALKEDKTDFIQYLIADLGVDLMDKFSYSSTYLPDESKSYKTWEFAIQLIELSLEQK